MGMYPGGNLIKLSPTDLVDSAYSAGDVVFGKHELKNAVPSRGGCSLLMSITAFIEGASTDDDLILLFFDNSTDLGAAVDAAGTDIRADEFRTASCIGAMQIDGGATSASDIGNGRVYVNSTNAGDTASPVFIKAAGGETSIWVACLQRAGTLDLVGTDSITLTFGFQYLG